MHDEAHRKTKQWTALKIRISFLSIVESSCKYIYKEKKERKLFVRTIIVRILLVLASMSSSSSSNTFTFLHFWKEENKFTWSMISAWWIVLSYEHPPCDRYCCYFEATFCKSLMVLCLCNIENSDRLLFFQGSCAFT